MTGSPPLPLEALRHLGEQQAHALGDEGALEEGAGVLILAASPCRMRTAVMSAANSDCWNVPFEHVAMGNGDFSPGFHRSWCSSSWQIRQSGCLVCRLRRRAGGGFDAGPAGDEFVVGAGVFGPALALAERVEAVGELADGFRRLLASAASRRACAGLAATA